jgi:hypothetical protein
VQVKKKTLKKWTEDAVLLYTVNLLRYHKYFLDFFGAAHWQIKVAKLVLHIETILQL